MKVKIKRKQLQQKTTATASKNEAIDNDNNDLMDSSWWKSLARGVISEMEKDGIIKKGLFSDDDFEVGDEDELIQEFEVGCNDDEVYQRAKKIQALDKAIVKRQKVLKHLDKVIKQKGCKQPSNDELLAYCNKIILVGKGKALDTKK